MEYVSISMGLCSHHTTQEGNPLCLPVWANWRRPSQPWSTGLTASWCQCALLLVETDVLRKINGNTGKENLHTNIEAMSVRKLKLGCNCTIQKYFQNGVRATKLKSGRWSGRQKVLTLAKYKTCCRFWNYIWTTDNRFVCPYVPDVVRAVVSGGMDQSCSN